MRKLFDFKCPRCDHVKEALVEDGVTSITCPECATNMQRQIATPTIKLEGWSGAFPTAASKWERQHERAAKEKP